ncbi:DUF3710 domain-containing protein [Streptomyces olivochromogenes]|uniref:DUF3710 domain-containing protein n=1 Tax=Streptomyces TaxID=1883 RepID=UPI00368830BF
MATQEARSATCGFAHAGSYLRVRFLGHDGPGWLLRGVVTGAGAAPESTDQWAYRLFASSVVVPSFSPPENGSAIALNIPDGFHGQHGDRS